VKKILLAGEGKNELGGWVDPFPYRDPLRIGVLEALLRKIAPGDFKISDAIVWKNIRKYRAGQHRGAETRAVLGLMQEGKERKFDAVVFTRDRDGEKPEHEQRQRDVLHGIEEGPNVLPGAPPVVGGLAVERLESWVLALHGVASTESMKNGEVDRRLASKGIGEKDTDAFVEAVSEARLAALPDDAHSLRHWLTRATNVLSSSGRPPR
jgi:hypothetical protein